MATLRAVDSKINGEHPVPLAFTLTVAQCFEAEAALTRLAAPTAEKIDQKLAYHIGKLLRLVRAETRDFNEQRDEWIKELGHTDPNGQFTVKPEHLVAFGTRVKERLAVETLIPWTPLTYAELAAHPRVCGEDYAQLGPCFADDDRAAATSAQPQETAS